MYSFCTLFVRIADYADYADGVSCAFEVYFHKLALILANPDRCQFSTEKGNDG